MSQFRLTYLVTVRPNLIKNTDTFGVIGGNTAQRDNKKALRAAKQQRAMTDNS